MITISLKPVSRVCAARPLAVLIEMVMTHERIHVYETREF